MISFFSYSVAALHFVFLSGALDIRAGVISRVFFFLELDRVECIVCWLSLVLSILGYGHSQTTICHDPVLRIRHLGSVQTR